jgi:ATP-binding cassette subfamily B protein
MQALADVSVEARRGEMIGIVGRSGAGKSSLIHILLGMYPVSSGRIQIDDRNILEIDRMSLRQQIGIVSQDVHLFDTTIREVIAGGNPSLTDSEIVAAAHEAGIDDFIDTLPARYGTRVGERGMTLSGGQRQRLLLAQILARRPSVLVFDEAPSALDSRHEQRIFETIDKLRSDRICIVVTHRVERLRNASRIYVMSEGRIVQQGSWDALVAVEGPFQELRKSTPQAVEATAEAYGT